MGIFDKRVAFKPFEYPEVEEFKEAIQNSYWTFREFNYIADIQDFHTKLNSIEKNAIKNTLLAISQIEVSVKRFWVNLGQKFPKPEFDQVGISFGECHIDGTEILTPNGWVDFKNISVGDDVIQYHEDNTLSITTVLKKFGENYSGKMFRFHKKSSEAIVTPNHRIVYYNHKGEYKNIYAKDINVKNSSIKLPESGILINEANHNDILSPIERLRIALQADGNRRYYKTKSGRKPRLGNGCGSEYEIRIQKPRKIERLDLILESSKVDFTKLPIPSRPGMFCYTIRIDNDFDYKKLEWVNLYNKNYKWCLDFVEELSEWDGHRLPNKKDCQIKFSSTCKATADKAQMIGVAAGYRTCMGIYKDNRKQSYKDTYIIGFTKNRKRTTLPPTKKEEINYSGFVHCVSVESGAIITRYNGKTFIGGNSEIRHADAYSHLLEKLDLNHDFELLLQNPVIQGRVDYLTKYLKGASDSCLENYTLTLALFSIFIENVSLFSQFAIIKSFNKYLNVLKDVDNTVYATFVEEQLHADFGIYLINKVKEEYPNWFNEDFYDKIYRACKKSYEAESKIIDWIFEEGELEFLSKDTLKEFIKDRFNESIQMIGGEAVFEIDQEKLKPIQWFKEETLAKVNFDFFNKKPNTYSKFNQPVTSEDLF